MLWINSTNRIFGASIKAFWA